MDRTLPAAPKATSAPIEEHRAPVRASRPLSVAFLPLALVSFIVLSFVIASWTFLAAAA